MSNPPTSLLRIGEIARRTGLSAKALRLYDQRGLLQPCSHSPAGYRLYGPVALQRLHQIVLLKRSGFSLEQIGRLLQRDPHAAATLLAQRVDALQQEVEQRTQALVALRAAMECAGPTSTFTVDQLLEHLSMSQHIKPPASDAERDALHRHAERMGAYFNADEQAQLRARADAMGEAALQQSQRDWAALIGEVRAAMAAGVRADSAEAQAFGQRWHALVRGFTAGDPEITRKLREAYQQEPSLAQEHGLDPAMFGWVQAAMQAAGLSLS